MLYQNCIILRHIFTWIGLIHEQTKQETALVFYAVQSLLTFFRSFSNGFATRTHGPATSSVISFTQFNRNDFIWIWLINVQPTPIMIVVKWAQVVNLHWMKAKIIFMDASQLNTRKLITQIYYKTYFNWNKNNTTQGPELIFVTHHQDIY